MNEKLLESNESATIFSIYVSVGPGTKDGEIRYVVVPAINVEAMAIIMNYPNLDCIISVNDWFHSVQAEIYNPDNLQLMADTANGCFVVESFDNYNECNVGSQVEFYKSLDSLKDGETICASVDEEMFQKIYEEYGIQILGLKKIGLKRRRNATVA